MAKEIQLTNGGVTIVDDDDFVEQSKYRWNKNPGGYAQRGTKVKSKWKTLLLHREVMNAPSGLVIDHINFDTLDNRKENLRLCSHSENMAHSRSLNPKKTSTFKGVYFHVRKGKWHARIQEERKSRHSTYHLGYYVIEIEAAFTYNVAAHLVYHEFAVLNDIPPDAISPSRRIEIESIVRSKLIAKGVISA